MRAGKMLAFYSLNSYASEVDMPDIILSNFKKISEGAAAPYPSIAYNTWSQPGLSDTPSVGLAIDAAIDVSGNEDIARGAEMLGFSDSTNRVMAQLALMPQQLASGRINGSKALELKEYVRSSSQYAVIDFTQKSLTE